MYEEEIHFGKLLLKESETVLTHLSPVTVTFDPVTLNSKGFLCCPGWMRGQSLWKVGKFYFNHPYVCHMELSNPNCLTDTVRQQGLESLLRHTQGNFFLHI